MKASCSVYKAADLIGKRWTILILLELYKGGRWKRYTELKSKIMNITPKILSMRLKELENGGLIEKRVDAKSFPIKSEYRLTAAGKDFIKVIQQIKSWSLRWKSDNKECNGKDCKECTF
jgi:DNA-binding HxlR family transcriptional regulator